MEATKTQTLTVWELQQLEAKPAGFYEKIIDRVVCLLPLLAAALVLVQYNFMPNFREFTALDTHAPSNVYNWFIGIFIALFLAWNIAAIFSQKFFAKLRKAAPFYTAVFILLIAYDWATLKTGRLPLPFFPWPDAILNAIISDRAILWESTYHSLRLLFTGYGLGVAAGLITGIFAGWSSAVRYWVQPIVRILGPIPAITWLPIILIVATNLFGGSVFLIALGVWYPVTMTSMTGVLNLPKGYFEAARTFGAGETRMIFKVAVPAITPFIFQGMTQGMAIACAALLVAEMMGVEAGLGWYITWQRGWAQFANMYGAIIVICLTFFLVNAVLMAARRHVLRWKEGNDS